MAVWNNFGKKASNTTAKAVQQAKILTETSRLNTLISEEKKKINSFYSQIGQAYAQVHHDDYEPGFGELMKALAETERRIREYDAQIKKLRGVVDCPGCGAELPMNAAFCSACGATIPHKEPIRPAVKAGSVCSRCGASMAEGVRFCTSCGAPMAEKPVVAQPAGEEESVTAPAAQYICCNCGALLEADSVFCSECGYPVAAPVQDTTAPAAPAERRCTNCGEVLDPDSLFCTECGTRI